MVKRVFCLCFLACLLFSGCGKKKRVIQAPPVFSGATERGLATWYGHGDGYHGRTTASGERFDKNRLTAAHFSLPFGTTVRVRNLNNGREVVVRINDRFPEETLRKGRIIDVSYKAARLLDMVRVGVVPVLLEIIAIPPHGGGY